MNSFSWKRFQTVPLIGILRGFARTWLPGIVRSSIGGGLTSLEITMNTPGAADQIREVIELAEGKLNVGAGTVLDLDLLHTALAAGASFIVTPNLQEDLVRACVERQIPVFPGAFTPSELTRAKDLGAAWVKVFPADALGFGYFRAVRQVLPEPRLLATGGITLESLPEWQAAGADGFGVGSPLFDPARIRAGDWAWLSGRCQAFVEACTRHRVRAQ